MASQRVSLQFHFGNRKFSVVFLLIIETEESFFFVFFHRQSINVNDVKSRHFILCVCECIWLDAVSRYLGFCAKCLKIHFEILCCNSYTKNWIKKERKNKRNLTDTKNTHNAMRRQKNCVCLFTCQSNFGFSFCCLMWWRQQHQ